MIVNKRIDCPCSMDGVKWGNEFFGRRTGKTTSAILDALSMAIRNPSEWVEVVDPDLEHHPNTAKYHVLPMARRLIDALALLDIEAKSDRGKVFIKNSYTNRI